MIFHLDWMYIGHIFYNPLQETPKVKSCNALMFHHYNCFASSRGVANCIQPLDYYSCGNMFISVNK